jgi:hypothetical protein
VTAGLGEVVMSDETEYRKAAAERAKLLPERRCADCRVEISILNDYGLCGGCVGLRRKAFEAGL